MERSGCGMFGIWNDWDVEFSGCGTFSMGNVRDVGCLAYRIFRVLIVWNVECLIYGRWLGCETFGMWDLVYLPCSGMLIYKIDLFVAIFL